MSTPQDQYREYIEQNQQALQTAMDRWSKTVEQTVGAFPTNPTQVDPQQVVDQVFDFAEQMLQMQRDFTRNLVSSSLALSKSVTGEGQDSQAPAEV